MAGGRGLQLPACIAAPRCMLGVVVSARRRPADRNEGGPAEMAAARAGRL